MQKIIKNGMWYWPDMPCKCGAIGCYDLTTAIVCAECLAKVGKPVYLTASSSFDSAKMSEAELIARQAKQIEELRDEVSDLKERARKARMHIYCIGGPLNDNKLGYTKEQMVTFSRIANELSEES